MVGLARVNMNAGYLHLDYAFYARSDGKLSIYELGKHKGVKGTYLPEDVLTISRVKDVVSYYKNGILVYTSLTRSTAPLFVDSSISSLGGSVNSVETTGFSSGDQDQDGLPDRWEQAIIDASPDLSLLEEVTPEGDIDGDYHMNIVEYLQGSDPSVADREAKAILDWASLRNTSVITPSIYVTGSDLQKTGTRLSWDADGISKHFIAVDGGVTFSVVNSEDRVMLGLNKVNNSASYQDLDYCIYINNNSFYVRESGVNKKWGGFASIWDTFSIERIGGEIFYLRNGEVFYTSLIHTTAPLIVDTAFLDLEAKLINVASTGASISVDSDLDGIADINEIQLINHSDNDSVTDLSHIDETTDFDQDGYLDVTEIASGSNAAVGVLDVNSLETVYWRDLINLVKIPNGVQKEVSARRGWNAGGLSKRLMEADGVILQGDF